MQPILFSLSTDSVRVLFEKGTYFLNDLLDTNATKIVPGAKEELVPYSLQQDVVVTGIMVVAFLLLCYALSRGCSLIARQLSDFFTERKRNNMFVETSNEFRYQGFLILHAAIIMSVLLYDQWLHQVIPSYRAPSWQVLGWCFLGWLGYFVLKSALYELVNWVFFDRAKCERWREILYLVISLQGVLFFPVVCVSIYSDYGSQYILPIIIFIILISKILLIYKSNSIFFVNLRGIFYNILYLCTLEMIPLLVLWRVIREIS